MQFGEAETDFLRERDQRQTFDSFLTVDAFASGSADWLDEAARFVVTDGGWAHADAAGYFADSECVHAPMIRNFHIADLDLKSA